MTSVFNPVQHAVLPSGVAAFQHQIPIRARYDNWIGGEYVKPVRGQYFDNPTPTVPDALAPLTPATEGRPVSTYRRHTATIPRA